MVVRYVAQKALPHSLVAHKGPADYSADSVNDIASSRMVLHTYNTR